MGAEHREATMSLPVQRWIEGRGYTFYAEVQEPYGASIIDAVGIRNDPPEIVIVEMKRNLTRGLLRQINAHGLITAELFVAVLSRPRSLDECRKMGIGVLRVREDAVTCLLSPVPRLAPMPYYAEKLRYALSHCQRGGIAGKPCERGQGPAQDCMRAVEVYRLAHVGATWKEIFAAVPNHYANAKSMAHSLCGFWEKLEQRRALQRAIRYARR